jgi:hypothetical protein
MIRIVKRTMSGGRTITEAMWEDEKIGTVFPCDLGEMKFKVCLDLGFYSHTTVNFDGYGKTPEEAVRNAIANCKSGLAEMEDRLQSLEVDYRTHGVSVVPFLGAEDSDTFSMRPF